jgi:hypothetical protein
MQEPWDHARFVAAYNRLADERGGWHFEGDRAEEDLRARYLRSPETYPDLAAFTEGLFIWDQRVNL